MELGAFSISLALKDLGASQAFYEKLGFERNILTWNPGLTNRKEQLQDFADVREIQRELEAGGWSSPSASTRRARVRVTSRWSTPTATPSSSTSSSDPVASPGSLVQRVRLECAAVGPLRHPCMGGVKDHGRCDVGLVRLLPP